MPNMVSDKARFVAKLFTAELPLGLKNLFLPAFCRKCGVRILTEENLYFCRDCWATVETVGDPKCPCCGKPHSVRVGFDEIYNFVCSECAARKTWVTHTYAAGIHVGVLRDAIHLLKFGRKRLMARPLAQLLIEHALPEIDIGSYDFFTPVPLHRKRLGERGFNQSVLIAERIREEVDGLSCETLVARVKDTPSFSRLGAAERREWIKKAFRLVSDAEVKKKRILLIDDVVTTGATTNECARVLRRGGAERVDVLAVAVARRLS